MTKSTQSNIVSWQGHNIFGDYPYYRDSPDLWEKKINSVKSMGVDVITFYVPWRHHQSSRTGWINFEGAGNRNLIKFIGLIRDSGLKAIAKPGPFIHAEVKFGGLPDKLCAKRNPAITPLRDGSGNPILSEGRHFPDYMDPTFREESIRWLTAFSSKVLSQFSGPEGPIIGVQIGNEGVFSDSNRLIHDFVRPGDDRSVYEILFSEWKETLNSDVLITNFCPPSSKPVELDGRDIRLDTWHKQVSSGLASGARYGFSSWVGHPLHSRQSLKSILLAVKMAPGISMEENGGFTWEDDYWKFAESFVQSTGVMIGAGALGVCLYPAVSTSSWGYEIETTKKDLSENLDKLKCYGRPYGSDCAILSNADVNEDKYKKLKNYFGFLARNRQVFHLQPRSPVHIILPNPSLAQSDDGSISRLDVVLDTLIDLGVDFSLGYEEDAIAEPVQLVVCIGGTAEPLSYAGAAVRCDDDAFSVIDSEATARSYASMESYFATVLQRPGGNRKSILSMMRSSGNKELVTLVNIGDDTAREQVLTENARINVTLSPRSVSLAILIDGSLHDYFHASDPNQSGSVNSVSVANSLEDAMAI